jgi:hypothetical protein
MAAKLTRMTHEIAIQLHLVAESCTIRSSRSRRPVRKLLDTVVQLSGLPSLCLICPVQSCISLSVLYFACILCDFQND